MDHTSTPTNCGITTKTSGRWSILGSSATTSTAAAIHADVLARRRKCSDPDVEPLSPILAEQSTAGEFSRFSDSLEALRQDLLVQRCDLEKKLDGVASHLETLETCFNSFGRDLPQQIADALQLPCLNLVEPSQTKDPKHEHSLSSTLCVEPPSPPQAIESTRKKLQSSFHPRFWENLQPNSHLNPEGRINMSDSVHHTENDKPNQIIEGEGVVHESEGTQRPSLQKAPSPVWSANSFHWGSVLHRTRKRGKLAQLAWLYLEDPRLAPGGRLYVLVMIIFVLASIVLTVWQTVESPPLGRFTEAVLECLVDGLLTMEILVRFVVCPNQCAFWANGHNLLDMVNGPLTLLARVVLPFLFPNDVGPDGSATLLLNAYLPVSRLLRLLRRFEGAHLIYKSITLASEALPVLLYVLIVIATTAASILYSIEARDNITSYPHALWLTVVTLGTVGYGDVTPETPVGKVVICILVIVAALYMAMPLGIVGKVFAEVWDERSRILLTQLARRRFRAMGYTPSDVPALFLSFDTNLDGRLSEDEFINMMKKMHFDISGDRARKLFKVFDEDGGGYIEDREFMNILFPEALETIYGPDMES